MDKFWVGQLTNCDWCSAPFSVAKAGDKMYDAKSLMGPWGNFCARCFPTVTQGKLGTGLGQEYTRQADGKWLKTGG